MSDDRTGFELPPVQVSSHTVGEIRAAVRRQISRDIETGVRDESHGEAPHHEDYQDWLREHNRLSALDLLSEAAEYLLSDATDEDELEVIIASDWGRAAVLGVYYPAIGRAGIAWGGNAQWTDADSALDAIERYFGVDGKEISN